MYCLKAQQLCTVDADTGDYLSVLRTQRYFFLKRFGGGMRDGGGGVGGGGGGGGLWGGVGAGGVTHNPLFVPSTKRVSI